MWLDSFYEFYTIFLIDWYNDKICIRGVKISLNINLAGEAWILFSTEYFLFLIY